MIVPCIAALQLFSLGALNQFDQKAELKITACHLNTETKRSWIETEWDFKDSGYHSRITVNHVFDPETCRISHLYSYVDDIKGMMTGKEKRAVLQHRTDAWVYLIGFVRKTCIKEILGLKL